MPSLYRFCAVLAIGLLAKSVNADTATNRLGLTLPTIGSPSWGNKINQDMAIIDAQAGVTSTTNTFVSSNVFTGYTSFTSTVNWQNLKQGSGQCLGVNTSSNTVYVPCGTGGGGSPGGSSTQVQYNNAGSFAGSSNFTTDGSSVTISTAIVYDANFIGGSVGITQVSASTTSVASTLNFYQPSTGSSSAVSQVLYITNCSDAVTPCYYYPFSFTIGAEPAFYFNANGNFFAPGYGVNRLGGTFRPNARSSVMDGSLIIGNSFSGKRYTDTQVIGDGNLWVDGGINTSTMTISTQTVTGEIILKDGTIITSTSTFGGGSSSGSGYAVQPATVTFNLAQGVIVDSGLVVGDLAGIVASTSVITSSMSVVLASAPVNGGFITLTLPSAASNPGLDLMIYKVDSGVGPIVIKGNGSDLIESTGTIYLNARFQHASLHSLGASGWGSGLGGIQATPSQLYPTPFSLHNSFFIGASSAMVGCPIYIPVPIIVTGYSYNGASANGTGISFGLIDINGNVVAKAGPFTLQNNLQTVTATPTNVSPGSYFLAVSQADTGPNINGGDVGNGNAQGCFYNNYGTGISKRVFDGQTPGTSPGISLIVSGGT